MASVLAVWRSGLCRLCSTRSVLKWPGPTLDVRRCDAGCEARGKAEGLLFHPGVTGKGQTGRVNASEPLFDVSLCVSPAGWDVVAGCRSWPL